MATPLVIKSDLGPVQELIAKGDTKGILEGRFWNLLCLAIAQSRQPDRPFAVIIEDTSASIMAMSGEVRKMARIAERIQTLLFESYELKRNCSIVPITIESKVYLYPEQDLIEIDWDRKELDKTLYESDVEPLWPLIGQLIGAKVSLTSKEQFYTLTCRHYDQDVMVVKIKWLAHRIYAIDPVPIAPRKPLDTDLQEAFQNQLLCDLEIHSNGGSIKMHSVVLYAKGANVFRAMLTSQLLEAKTKTIQLQTFSDDVVRAFTTFLYYGHEQLSDEFLKKPPCNIFELFVFANVHQVKELEDCAVNLISLLDPEDHIDTINHLTEIHKNPHLVKLSEHLKSLQPAPSPAWAAAAAEPAISELSLENATAKQ